MATRSSAKVNMDTYSNYLQTAKTSGSTVSWPSSDDPIKMHVLYRMLRLINSQRYPIAQKDVPSQPGRGPGAAWAA